MSITQIAANFHITPTTQFHEWAQQTLDTTQFHERAQQTLDPTANSKVSLQTNRFRYHQKIKKKKQYIYI